jgi:hypothetical protein
VAHGWGDNGIEPEGEHAGAPFVALHRKTNYNLKNHQRRSFSLLET